ncbi:MAG: serine/threonine-protein kinase [Proteobacteria bacterium]|nr:serine/threonine-protein kinase [Pseudomonadota bacterium]
MIRAAVVALLTLLALVVPAAANKLVMPDLHGEADVADEAAAVSMLVRSALMHDTRTLVQPDLLPEHLTVALAPATLAKIDADTAILGELVREGTGLRVTMILVGREGASTVSLVRAGDGDVRGLAAGILERIRDTTHVTAGPVPAVGLGRLRPYIAAGRAMATDPAAGAAELADAIPTTANAAPGSTWGLHQADAHGNAAATAAFVKDALATDPVTQRMILAFASRPDAPKFSIELQKAILVFAEKTAGGVASRIGLAAARANLETPRALAMITARDLDDADLALLEPLVATGTDATSLRLRAELAMRRADATETIAIEAYLVGAPDDPRAHLYKGYQLMSEGKHDLAAAQFGEAKAPRERAHAQLLANDLQGAIETIAHAPISPEELVVSARIAVKEHRLVDAAAAIRAAEQVAPANPYVQRTIVDIAAQPGSPISAETAAFARTIADTGTAKVEASTTGTIKVDETALAGSGSSAGSGSAIALKKPSIPIDPQLAHLDLAALLNALPQLAQLSNRRVSIAELKWSPPTYSPRKTTPENLRPVLELALSSPPYRLTVGARPALDTRPLDSARLDVLLGDADALLTYQVQTSGSDAKIVLEIFARGAKATREVADTFPGAGLVGWDFSKLVPFGIVGLILILVAGYFLVRGSGVIRVTIERAPDASDEVFCVAISKSAGRPSVGDPVTFRAALKKAGSSVGRRGATMIASGIEFRMPPGRWFVHLYGTYERAGVVLPIPNSASREVTLKRGTIEPAKIDLVPTSAELVVVIEGDTKDVIAVSIDDGGPTYTANGQAVIPVARGAHVITFEAKGHTFKRDVATPQARIYRYAFNLARELRLLEAGLDGSSTVSEVQPPPHATAAPIDLEHDDIMSSPSLSNPVTGAGETMAAPGQDVNVKFGKTMALASKTSVDDDRLLDRYRKTAELGRGAMGVVHRAWDENLEREVAIKVMADELQQNPEAMRLFAQEAKALAQLNHTNIVTVYDQVTVGNKTYMIMEYVDGTTLEKLAQGRGAFPVREALEIADQLCAGLSYAHARRVIHRDIKPANIFISRDHTVKVGDFGLARVVRELTIRKTEIRGTPLYMAPEQITGNDLDHRVDLYAVGCTLYELLCGKPPFTEGDILYHQLHTPAPSPSALRAGLPPKLDDLVLSLLAKKADDRPATAQDVRNALKTI